MRNKIVSKWGSLGSLESAKSRPSYQDIDSLFGSKCSIEYVHGDEESAQNAYFDVISAPKEQSRPSPPPTLERQSSGYNFDELLSDDEES